MNKKLIGTATTLLYFCFTSFAQTTAYNKQWYKNENYAFANSSSELSYEVRGNYEHPVTKTKLSEAKLLSDFIPDYPVNWVSDYVSVEISAAVNDRPMKAVSANEVLSAEQRNILNAIEAGTGFVINVKYKARNSVTDDVVTNTMSVSMMVVPEIEAEYIGGYPLLKKYLKENVINKIYKANNFQLQNANARVLFTINEKGEITNAKITGKVADAHINKLLLEAINKMPKWKPAQNAKGMKVKQEYVFTFGNNGC